MRLGLFLRYITIVHHSLDRHRIKQLAYKASACVGVQYARVPSVIKDVVYAYYTDQRLLSSPVQRATNCALSHWSGTSTCGAHRQTTTTVLLMSLLSVAPAAFARGNFTVAGSLFGWLLMTIMMIAMMTDGLWEMCAHARNAIYSSACKQINTCRHTQ